MDARQAEVRRDLGEADRARSASGVTAYLCSREIDVPQRDDRQRDQPAAGVTTPLVDHPVVVGVDTRLGDVLVLGLGERLPAEPWERRERQGCLDMVHLHVLDTRL